MQPTPRRVQHRRPNPVWTGKNFRPLDSLLRRPVSEVERPAQAHLFPRVREMAAHNLLQKIKPPILGRDYGKPKQKVLILPRSFNDFQL